MPKGKGAQKRCPGCRSQSFLISRASAINQSGDPSPVVTTQESPGDSWALPPEMLTQQVWGKPQKYPGSGNTWLESSESGPSMFLASPANLCLYFHSSLKIHVCLQLRSTFSSFFNAFTCTLASGAALFVALASHSIQCKCLDVLHLS